MNIQIPKYLIPYFILAVFLLVIIFVVIFMLLRPQSTPPSNNSSDITPTATSSQKPQNTSPIREESVTPNEDTSGETIKNPSQKISFTLSEPVSTNSIRVNVSPSLPVKIQQGNNLSEVVVFPDPPEYWRPDTLYTITLLDFEGNVITTYQIDVPPLEIQEIRE